IVPIYNDGYLAEEFCQEFESVFRQYLGVNTISNDVELIFVNDGSSDDSIIQLKQLIKTYQFVKLISFSRNFGQHIALSCGYKHAKGEYVGMLNVDMQDPPDQIPLLLDRVSSAKVDFVLGLRKSRNSPLMDRVSSYLFHYF